MRSTFERNRLELGMLVFPLIEKRIEDLTRVADPSPEDLAKLIHELKEASSALRAIRSLIQDGGDILPLIDGELVAKLRDIRAFATPRDATEVPQVIMGICTSSVSPNERITQGLDRLIDGYAVVQNRLVRVSLYLGARDIAAAKREMRSCLELLRVSVRTPWMKIGQLMIALRIWVEDASPSSARRYFKPEALPSFLDIASVTADLSPSAS